MCSFEHIAAFAATAAFAASAAAARPAGTPADYGLPVPEAGTQRVISVTPAITTIRVINGETVTFDVNGKRFSWHVDTYPHVSHFDLKTIAPQGVGAEGVRVLVTPNPTYVGT